MQRYVTLYHQVFKCFVEWFGQMLFSVVKTREQQLSQRQACYVRGQWPWASQCRDCCDRFLHLWEPSRRVSAALCSSCLLNNKQQNTLPDTLLPHPTATPLGYGWQVNISLWPLPLCLFESCVLCWHISSSSSFTLGLLLLGTQYHQPFILNALL